MRMVTRIIAVVALMTVVGTSFTSTAVANRSSKERMFRTSDGNGYSNRDVRQLIRKAVHRWHVAGGVHKALSVARCESGYNERNRNPSSSASGVYQFLRATWDSVKQRYRSLMRRLNLGESVFNARSNVILAIRYAHAGGWSPWSCR